MKKPNNKPEKKIVPVKFYPIFEKYIGILSDLQKESKATDKFFKKYQETFLHHIQAVNHTSEKITSFIDDFERKIKENKNSKEEVPVDLFAMELCLLHEMFSEHMKMVLPVVNMSYAIKDMYDDLLFINTETNKRANYWLDKIYDLLKDEPLENQILVKK